MTPPILSYVTAKVLPLNGDRLDAAAILDRIARPLPPPVNRPALLMMVGLPGSGKSTLSRRIATEIDAVLLESDSLRRHFFARPSHSQDESRVLFTSIHEAMTVLLSQGVPVILDATNLKESDRRPVEAVAHKTGARLLTVCVNAPSAVIEQRLRDRTSAGDADISVYRRMARTFQPPAPAECLCIDTADEVFYEAAVQRIIQVALGRAAEHV